MEMTFQGWSRALQTHHRPVAPATVVTSEWRSGNEGEPIDWVSAKRAHGRVNGLSLGGNFLVVFEFEPAELQNWLQRFIADEPEAAVRLLGEMQAEATLCLAQKAKNDALEAIREKVERDQDTA